MIKAALKDEDQVTVQSVAREALDESNGDVVKATDLMVARVRADERLYRPLMDPLVREACYQTLTRLCRKNRRAIWSPAQPTAETEQGRIVALSEGIMSLLGFPLPGGQKLADATRADVIAAAEFYSRQATDMGHKARWLQLIAQHLPAKKTVGKVMTNERLTELRAEAMK